MVKKNLPSYVLKYSMIGLQVLKQIMYSSSLESARVDQGQFNSKHTLIYSKLSLNSNCNTIKNAFRVSLAVNTQA